MAITRGKDGSLFSFGDLPLHAFPVTITAYRGDEQIWQRVIEPYVAVEIPGSSGGVRLRIVYGNGEETWTEAITREEAMAHIDEEVRKAEDERD